VLLEQDQLESVLPEQYGPSMILLNSLAAARILGQDQSGAMSNLNDAMSLASEHSKTPPALPDTYINLLACLSSSDPTKAEAMLAKFSAEFPQHPYVQQMNVLNGAFNRVAAQFAA
jgi:hypothetical protein